MIDCGADVIWFDVPCWQAMLLDRITEDVNHPAVKESLEAVSKIVDEIRKYGQREGKRIYVGSWPAGTSHLEADFHTADWDFVTMSPKSSEVEEMKLDQARWDRDLTAVRKRYGDVPILAHIDWGASVDTPLGIFSQRLNREEQMEFLKTADDFFYRNGVIFIYPIHGGNMGTNATKLSHGRTPVYDSNAPEFQSYDTIKQLALSKKQATESAPTPTLTPTPSESQNVIFLDENLDKAIRDTLGKPVGEEITVAELATLTTLGAESSNITDLSGLEYCTNLTILTINENQISDLSPLASLTSLTEIGLGENQISDISPLASLANLTRTHLGENQISDISPLANLTSLTLLILWQNQISDISPLVENSGLGAGDKVLLEGNNLDLSEGSEDMENIRALENRGVVVNY